MFEQQLSDFKHSHPRLPILIIFAASNKSRKVIADMTNEIVQFAELLGNQLVFVAFGIDESEEDSVADQLLETSAVLREANVLHRVQYTKNLERWTRIALRGYMNDFEAAVILRGIICATDLTRLIMHTIENGAGITCAVDVTFTAHHLMASNPFNLDRISGMVIPTERLLQSRRLLQTGCCDGPVKVVTYRALRPSRSIRCRKGRWCSEDSASDPECGDCISSAKVMISPSVKSATDPDDFRSAMQLGFTDWQGFDYSTVEWEDSEEWEACAGSI
jgi:hypothetical protein